MAKANFLDDFLDQGFEGLSKALNKTAKMALFATQAAIIVGASALMISSEPQEEFVPKFSELEVLQPK
jgi:hypothetical protein